MPSTGQTLRRRRDAERLWYTDERAAGERNVYRPRNPTGTALYSITRPVDLPSRRLTSRNTASA
jgi:hypothetical protein